LAVPIIAARDLASARGIAQALVRLGHEVVSPWVLGENPGLSSPPEFVFSRDVNGVRKCDILVAEVSTPSHGVGMEIMLAHTLGKTVVCLHKPGVRLSRLLRGMPGITLREYDSLAAAEEALKTIHTVHP